MDDRADKRTVLDEVREYAEVVRRSFPVTKVVLYGSHATGTARADSDIDVAVILRRVKGDYLDSAALLFKLARNIDLRIEPVLLEESSDRSGFLSEVLRTGKVVYSRDG